MATKAPAETRSILIEFNSGDAQIVEGIPGDAKITYTHMNPGGGGHYNNAPCVRIYRGSSGGESGNQLAVFTDVKRFRDLSLSVKTRKVTRSETETTESQPGRKTARGAVSVVTQWMTDDPFAQLTNDAF